MIRRVSRDGFERDVPKILIEGSRSVQKTISLRAGGGGGCRKIVVKERGKSVRSSHGWYFIMGDRRGGLEFLIVSE